MSSFTRVVILGKIQRDPELKHLSSGTKNARFAIMTTDQFQQGGEWKHHNNFFEIECWGELAERVADTITKGMQVILEGRLKFESWEDNNGGKRSTIKIVADTVKEVKLPQSRDEYDQRDEREQRGSRDNGRGQQGSWQGRQQERSQNQRQQDDDLPF